MKNLSLSLNSSSSSMPSVNSVHRNSPTRTSGKFVASPVVPPPGVQSSSSTSLTNTQDGNRSTNAFQPEVRIQSVRPIPQVCDSLPPPMQLIPEQSAISMFKPSLDDNISTTGPEFERISPGTLLEQLKYNRYSNSSLDSGQGSDSIKLHSQANNRVSVHSCESFGSSTTESTSQQSSLSSSSSTSSSFCSSSSSSAASSSAISSGSFSGHVSLHSSGSLPPQNHSDINVSLTHVQMSNQSVFGKGNDAASVAERMASAQNGIPTKSNCSLKGVAAISSSLAAAGPPTIAEMLLHGVSDSEIIHNWLLKIGMNKYEQHFIDAAYDMASIAKMTPQDLSSIGITDPKIRSSFTSEIQKLNIPESLPEYVPCSLEEWLKLLNLYCYFQSLSQQGYSTIDKVSDLTWEDLEDVGINKLGHQKKILLAIKKIKNLKTKASKESENVGKCWTEKDVYGTIGQEHCRPTIMGGKGSDYLTQQSLYPGQQLPLNQQQTFVSVHHNPLPLNLNQGFQDVPIKINAHLDSPTSCIPNGTSSRTPTNGSYDNYASVVFGGKQVPNCLPKNGQIPIMPAQMSTFQQLSDMERMNMNPNFVPNSGLYGRIGFDNGSVSQSMQQQPPVQQNNFGTFGRGKSLESLDNIDPKFYPYYQQPIRYQQQHQQQQNILTQPNIAQNAPLTYQQKQGSVNDLYSLNRQSMFYEQQQQSQSPFLQMVSPLPTMHSFNYLQPQIPIGQSSHDPDGTICRPKSFLQKSKPVAMIPARPLTQNDLYEQNFDTISIKSGGDISVTSDSTISCKSDLGLYSTLKKKPPPPPPPKRTNSVKSINSLPATPIRKCFEDEQIYSNLPQALFQNSSQPPVHNGNQFQQNTFINSQPHMNMISKQNVLQNTELSFSEDVFASCVKSLRNQFNEIHTFRDEDFQQASQKVSANNLFNQSASVPVTPISVPVTPTSSISLAAPNSVFAESIISNSSSTESMPFANDNIGTIRQKQSSFLQNALKWAHENSKSYSSSSSSSSPSVSSPMFANSMTSFPLQATEIKENSVDSSKQVVDSLEDIEKMLANLKTQLDQIE